MSATTIQEQLFSLQDPAYGDFTRKLIPTIDPASMIGVRTPALRLLAKNLRGTPEAAEFLQALPHQYHEENNLHGFLLEQIREFDPCIAAVEDFLPYVNNWATCDGTSPKVFLKDLTALLAHLRIWLRSDHVYTVRFGLVTLMRFYLDKEFRPEYLALAASVRSEEYYIRMMVAWFFATALAKHYDHALPYLLDHRLEPWVHNKTIQKAVESYRITPEQKIFLKTLKVKS